MKNNERLRRCLPQTSCVRLDTGLILMNSCAPIVVISLFALIRDDTNIFYVNATNVGYRLLEFNLGVCLYTSMQLCPLTCSKFAHVINYVGKYIVVLFVLVWWAELGTAVQSSYDTCIRMYHFSPCIEMHHGFLMRGCLLGITLLCMIVIAEDRPPLPIASADSGAWAACIPCGLSTIVFTWPVCYIVHLLLEANFGLWLVYDNAALLVLVVPHITFAAAFLWNATWKVRIFNAAEAAVDRALRRCRIV